MIIGTLRIKTITPFKKSLSENMGNINAETLLDPSTAQQTATEIDQFARAITGLLTSTYDDSEVSINLSTNEILAE